MKRQVCPKWDESGRRQLVTLFATISISNNSQSINNQFFLKCIVLVFLNAMCWFSEKDTHEMTTQRCVALGWMVDDAFVFVKVCKLHTKLSHEMTTLRCVALGWLIG